MANTLLIKGSKTSTAQPSLSYGADDGDGDASTEIAINRADGKLFYLDDSNQVTEFGTVSSGSAGTFAVYADSGTTIVDSDQQGTGEPDGSIYYDNTNYAILKLWREDGSSSGTNGFGSLYFGNTDYSDTHTSPNAAIKCYGGGVTQSNTDGGANMTLSSIAAGSTTLTTRLKLSSTGDTLVQNGNFIVDGGNLYIEGDDSAPGQLRIYEDTDLGTNYTAFT
ncbi:MAG: hypothetical protein QF535_01670, partial [Anaerolineales bacterium]|nr:hypothetical protein [Anaerolineales bacterium]